MTNRVSRRSTLGLLGAVPVVTALPAPDRGPTIPDGLRPGGELDTFAARLAAEDRFSGTILLTHHGRTVLSRSDGMADKARAVPNGTDTVFNLGSITKLFTAVSIAQLVQRGVVDYHANVGAYLSGFPASVAGSVTVHHLVTHHSGLGDHMRSEEYWAEVPTWDTVEKTWDGNLRFVMRAEPAYPPGSASTYSNAGYTILGAIVAAVSGRSYYDYVRENVFRRAGMSTADFYTRPRWREDRRLAHPYATPDRVDQVDRDLFVGSPAGGAFASAPDLVRFAAALRGDRLLDPAYTHLLHGAKEPLGRRGNQVSFHTYAPMAILAGGQWLYWHNGGAPGISTELAWYPTSGWTTVVLSNYDRATAPIEALARTLITTR